MATFLTSQRHQIVPVMCACSKTKFAIYKSVPIPMPKFPEIWGERVKDHLLSGEWLTLINMWVNLEIKPTELRKTLS